MVLLEVQAKEGTGDQLVAALRELLPDTRARDGSIEILAHQGQDDRDNIVLVDRWETRDAFDSYMEWRQETGVLDQLLAACVGPPSIRFYDITDA
ncbi:MAG: antibiotic biosynthesis monooxygenase family protein [Gemmatimonadota bacterium]